MYVVRCVGDWICKTVWSSSRPLPISFSLSSSSSSSSARFFRSVIAGNSRRFLGFGGAGRERLSWRRCTKESDGSAVSDEILNRQRGSVPVDENKEMIEGCTVVENSILNSRREKNGVTEPCYENAKRCVTFTCAGNKRVR